MRRRSRVIDINLVPTEYQRRLRLSLQAILIALIILLLVPVYPLSQWRATALQELDLVQEQLNAKLDEEAQLEALEEEVNQLKTAIQQLEQKLQAMPVDYQTFSQQRVRWHQVLAALLDSPPGITLGPTVTQNGAQITVKGVAPDRDTVTQYAQKLENYMVENSPLFSRVFPEEMIGSTGSVSFSFILEIGSQG
jgi:Tfp pilus assembly protein PilN